MAKLYVERLVKVLKDKNRRFRLDVPHFSLEPGDCKAILGVTGSGKTTAMDILALASPVNRAGQFRLEADGSTHDLGTGAAHADLARLRARHFGYVFQSSPLFPFLSLKENILLSQQLAGRKNGKLITSLLAALDLRVDPRTKVTDLSVGQRQRVAVARALAHRPSFIMCDEPTASLDPATARRLIRLIVMLAREYRSAVLIITHNPELLEDHNFEIFRTIPNKKSNHSTLRPHN
ncbi:MULTISPECIES: ABC transporter ATP-binding protein [unclassified Roseibium]|uniref:ABC transporter ATP-binding protein n=1 Tax=unclassified Roseibium TaxID=2629323 RepID=UPI00318241E7